MFEDQEDQKTTRVFSVLIKPQRNEFKTETDSQRFSNRAQSSEKNLVFVVITAKSFVRILKRVP